MGGGAMVAQLTLDQKVGGSNPPRPARFHAQRTAPAGRPLCRTKHYVTEMSRAQDLLCVWREQKRAQPVGDLTALRGKHVRVGAKRDRLGFPLGHERLLPLAPLARNGVVTQVDHYIPPDSTAGELALLDTALCHGHS